MEKSLKLINAKIEETLKTIDCVGFSDEAARAQMGWPGLSQTWTSNSKTNSGKEDWEKTPPEEWGAKEAESAVEALQDMQENGETDTQDYKDLLQACDTYVSDNPNANSANTYQETGQMEAAIEDADIVGLNGRTYVPPADDPDEGFNELDFRTGDTPYGEEGEQMGGDGNEDFENDELDSMAETEEMRQGREEARQEAEEAEVTEDSFSKVDSDIEQAAREAENRNMDSEAQESFDADTAEDISQLADTPQGTSNSDPQREDFNQQMSDVLDSIENSSNPAEARDQMRDEIDGVDNYIDPRTGNELSESPGWVDDQ